MTFALRPVSRLAAALLGGVLAVGLAGCTGGTDLKPTALPSASNPATGRDDPAKQPAYTPFYEQKPVWTDCGDGFQCSRVSVPLDWSAPAGATIKLAVIRLRASGHRLGSLLVNPGGPGVSGVAWARHARDVYGQSLRETYDIVGWDPRGVGQSAPISCLPDSALDSFFADDATPDDSAELATSIADAKGFAAACQRNTGALLAHVDTISTVRDMDVLRAVLGDSVLSYFGASYGTFLGAWYAQEFPWRVGRLVLDGVVDPALSAAQYVQGQAMGFQRGLNAYLADCRTRQGCPLRGTVEDAYGTLAALVSRADARPLRTASASRPLTQSLLTTGLAQGLYDSRYWPTLTQALGEALQGDGTTMLRLADAYLERDSSGHYAQTLTATGPIYCLDHAETRTPEQIAADAASVERSYPPLGDTIAWQALGCAEWPIKAVVPAQRLTAAGAAPILLVGTRGDPATPYEWARSLAGQLSSARLLTWNGEGHTAYGRGSSCIDKSIEAYLVSGTLPASGATCAA